MAPLAPDDSLLRIGQAKNIFLISSMRHFSSEISTTDMFTSDGASLQPLTSADPDTAHPESKLH